MKRRRVIRNPHWLMPDCVGRLDALFASRVPGKGRLLSTDIVVRVRVDKDRCEHVLAAADQPQWLPPGWYDAMLKQMTEWVRHQNKEE